METKKVMCGKCMKLIREEPLGSPGLYFDRCDECKNGKKNKQ